MITEQVYESSLSSSRSLVLPLRVILPKKPFPTLPMRSAVLVDDCLMLLKRATDAPDTWLNEADVTIAAPPFFPAALPFSPKRSVERFRTAGVPSFPIRSWRRGAVFGSSNSRWLRSSSLAKPVDGRRTGVAREEVPSSCLIERERDRRLAKRGLLFFETTTWPFSGSVGTFLGWRPPCPRGSSEPSPPMPER